MKNVTFDSQKYLVPSWEEMGSLCFALAKKIDTAALFLKPWSVLKPTFYAETTDAWIIYFIKRYE